MKHLPAADCENGKPGKGMPVAGEPPAEGPTLQAALHTADVDFSALTMS